MKFHSKIIANSLNNTHHALICSQPWSTGMPVWWTMVTCIHTCSNIVICFHLQWSPSCGQVGTQYSFKCGQPTNIVKCLMDIWSITWNQVKPYRCGLNFHWIFFFSIALNHGFYKRSMSKHHDIKFNRLEVGFSILEWDQQWKLRKNLEILSILNIPQ